MNGKRHMLLLGCWLVVSVAQGEDKPTKLRVAFPQAVMARERYVALAVAETGWEKPVAEGLFGPGEDAVLAPPPGEYRVFCSALGYEPAFGGEVLLEEGKEKEFSCDVGKLVTVCGTLVSQETGLPVAGGTVEVASVGTKQPFLSPQGLEHVRRTFRVTSDKQGNFCVPGKPGFTAPLHAWAPGFAKTTVPKVLFKDKSPPLPAVVLVREAVVEVHFPDWEGFLGRLPAWLFFLDETRREVIHQELIPEFPYEVHHLPAGAYEVLLGSEPVIDTARAVGHVALEAGELAALTLAWVEARLAGTVRGDVDPGSCELLFRRLQGDEWQPKVPLEPGKDGEARFSFVWNRLGRHLVLLHCKQGASEWFRALGEVEVKPGRSFQELAFQVEKARFTVALGGTAAAVGCEEVVAATPGYTVTQDYGLCSGPPGPDGSFGCPLPMAEAVVFTKAAGGLIAGPELVKNGGTLRWEQAREVEFSVTDWRGNAVERAWVTALPVPAAPVVLTSGRTDSTGTVRLSLPPRDVIVTVAPKAWGASREEELGSIAMVCAAAQRRCPVALPPPATLVVRGGVQGWSGMPVLELEGLLVPSHPLSFPSRWLGQDLLLPRLPSGWRVRVMELSAEGEPTPLTRPLLLNPGERRGVSLAPRGQ